MLILVTCLSFLFIHHPPALVPWHPKLLLKMLLFSMLLLQLKRERYEDNVKVRQRGMNQIERLSFDSRAATDTLHSSTLFNPRRQQRRTLKRS